MIFVSVASMGLGAFAAIGQKNIKRLMAYSSIGHVGYALVGLSAGTLEGIRGVIVYMTIYMVMTLGGFACILAMRRRGQMVEEISDLSGLSKTNPTLALALAIFMFSMAGIPPLAGFFGKLYVFLAAVDAGLYGLAIFGVLASVVGAYYYIRIVKVMYFDEPTDGSTVRSAWSFPPCSRVQASLRFSSSPIRHPSWPGRKPPPRRSYPDDEISPHAADGAAARLCPDRPRRGRQHQ